MSDQKIIFITADYREAASGIPGMLALRASLKIEPLTTGDYIINSRVTVERKSAEDFIQSILANRLFPQCARLRNTAFNPVILLEGNPYKTHHRLKEQAIRGALLSIKTAWQIPVIYAKNKEESVGLMMMIGRQAVKETSFIRLTNGFKPRRIKNNKLRFLQGLPSVGPTIANRLYDHFGSIKSVIASTQEELLNVRGVGKNAAKEINAFLNNQ